MRQRDAGGRVPFADGFAADSFCPPAVHFRCKRDDRGVFQALPDELPDIDIHSL
jgi:hypothetical protein